MRSAITVGAVDPVLFGLLCAAFGLVVGVGSMLAFRASERSRTVDMTIDEPTLPSGASEVLSVIGRAYAVVDAVDGVVKANPSAYAMGLVRGYTLVHAEVRELTARVRAEGVTMERRHELQRGPLGQGAIVVGLRVAPLDDEYILILADDRTEITRTEAMRHDFVVNVSHELKTPVGAISLLSETIDDAAEDEDAVRRFAGRLKVESVRLSALVQDIIELSRLQSKDVVHEGAPVDVNRVAAEAVDRVRLTAEARGITVKLGGHVDRPVHGDADQLMTAVRNLVDNAVRYSPDKTTVGVGVSSVDGLAQVTVTDQGIGIGADEQDRVFERFYRVDSARSRQTGGTGLGLSIVKHVVANHGGEVTVWSQPGRGSTFTIRLPLWEDETDHRTSADSPGGDTPTRRPGAVTADRGTSAQRKEHST